MQGTSVPMTWEASCTVVPLAAADKGCTNAVAWTRGMARQLWYGSPHAITEVCCNQKRLAVHHKELCAEVTQWDSKEWQRSQITHGDLKPSAGLVPPYVGKAQTWFMQPMSAPVSTPRLASFTSPSMAAANSLFCVACKPADSMDGILEARRLHEVGNARCRTWCHT
jgi:hypothetical protein